MRSLRMKKRPTAFQPWSAFLFETVGYYYFFAAAFAILG